MKLSCHWLSLCHYLCATRENIYLWYMRFKKIEPEYCHFCMKFLVLVCRMPQLWERVVCSISSLPPMLFSQWEMSLRDSKTSSETVEANWMKTNGEGLSIWGKSNNQGFCFILYFPCYPSSSVSRTVAFQILVMFPWCLLGTICFNNRSRTAKLKNGNYHNSMGLLPQHYQSLNSQPHRAALCLSMRR